MFEDAIDSDHRTRESIHRIRNLCIASMMEAVRDRTKTVDLQQVKLLIPTFPSQYPSELSQTDIG